MSAEVKLSPVQEKIERARVDVLKCTTADELAKFLADLETDCGVPMVETDKYGFLLQSLIVDKFDGLSRKGTSQFEAGTWEKFAELFLVAVHGR
jgi:hypothetical protein